MSKVQKFASPRRLRGKLLVSTAGAVCGMTLFAAPAMADVIPADCSTQGADPVEITCVKPAPDTIGQIYTSTGNTHVTVGTQDTPTAVVFDAGDAIIMSGNDEIALNVRAGSTVTSTGSSAVVMSSGQSANMSVLGAGSYTGQTDGMRLFQAGSGDVQVIAENITGVAGTGLVLNKYLNSSSAVINVLGTAAGAVNGVDIYDESQTAIIGGFNNVYGGVDGLAVDKDGDGDILLNFDGNVLGAAGNGIEIDHSGSGDIQVVTQGNLTGGLNAAWIELDGTGDITFVNAGTIDGTVRVRSRSISGSVFALVNNVVGDSVISAAADTPGSTASVTLVAEGHVDGTLLARANDGDLNITAQSVTSDTNTLGAVYGVSGGTGDVTLIVEGDVLARGGGVVAGNTVAGSVSIETQGVTSLESTGVAVNADPGTQGNVSILTHGDITSALSGIFTQHRGDGDIDITAEGALNAGTNGVRVIHEGDGNIVVDAKGDIAAQEQGILVGRGGNNNEPFGDGDVAITTGGKVSGVYGVLVDHRGKGDVAIDAAGPVTGQQSAISVTRTDEGAISIQAAGALASTDGAAVNVYALGNGDISVTTKEIVNGFASINVYAEGAGDISISAEKDLIGSALASGNGDISMQLAGSVTGNPMIDQAVYAVAPYGSIDLTVGGNVSGSKTGILAYAVDGLVNLDAGGFIQADEIGVDVTGASALLSIGSVQAGDIAVNLAASYDLTGTIASAIGGNYGVLAESSGDLTLDIGDAIGIGQSGIEAYVWDSIDLTVRGHVYGSDSGIRLYGLADQSWNVAIAEGAVVESEGFAFEMNALGGSGKLTLVNKGTIAGATGSGVFLSNSSTGDRFENFGLVTGNIQLGAGDDELLSTGTIIGTVWGNDGDDVFFNGGNFRGSVGDSDGINVVNAEGGLFEVVNSLGLSIGGGTFVNAGTFSSGGNGNIFTTTVNGSVLQDAAGTMLVDVDGQAGTADLLDVVGDAKLAGTISVNYTKPAAQMQDFLIVRTAGGDLADDGLKLVLQQASLSPLITFGLDFRTAKELYLTSLVDFVPAGAGLNPNQEAIGDALNDVFGQVPDAVSDLTDALFDNVDTLDDYADTLNQLVPEIYLNTRQTSLMAAHVFAREMSDCTTRDGAMLAEGKGCVKFSMGGDLHDRDASFENIAFDNGMLEVQAGYFTGLGPNLTLGFGVGYDDTLVRNAINDRAQGHRFQGATSLTYRAGGFALGGVLSAGFSSFGVDRRIVIGNFLSTSHGEQDVTTYTGELNASFAAQLGGLYLKPAASLIATRVHSGGFVETGGASTDYAIDKSSDWYVAARPSIELGGTVTLDENTVMMPFLRGGVTVLLNKDFSLSGRFADAPNSANGFEISSALENTNVDVEAGLQFRLGGSTSLSASYTGRYTDRSESHGFRVRASFAF